MNDYTKDFPYLLAYGMALGLIAWVLGTASTARRRQLLLKNGSKDCPVPKQLAMIKKTKERDGLGLQPPMLPHLASPESGGHATKPNTEESLAILESLRAKQLITVAEYQQKRARLLKEL